MKFKPILTIGGYKYVTEEIYKAHFADDEYIPHVGRIISMMLFYRLCTVDNKYKIPEDAEITDYESVFADEEFTKAFDEELRNPKHRNRLTFNQAYHDAMKMVDAKNASMRTFVDGIAATLVDFTQTFIGAIDSDNLETLKEIGNTYAKLNIDTDGLAEAAVNSYIEKTTNEQELE